MKDYKKKEIKETSNVQLHTDMKTKQYETESDKTNVEKNGRDARLLVKHASPLALYYSSTERHSQSISLGFEPASLRCLKGSRELDLNRLNFV